MRVPILFAAFLIACTLTSCSSSTSPGSNNSTATLYFHGGNFGYVLNGTSFDRTQSPTGNQGMATVRPVALGSNLKMLTVNLDYIPGFTFRNIILAVQYSSTSPATYALNDTTGNLAIVQLDTVQYQSQSGGIVTITKFDTVNNLVSGTFQFTATFGSQSVTVTSGYFTDIPIYGGSYGQGTISARINGASFVARSFPTEATAYFTGGSNLFCIEAVVANPLTSFERIITMYVTPVNVGTFALSGNLDGVLPEASYNTEFGNPDVIVSPATGQLVITTFDSVSHRMSGTFHFSGTDQSSGQTYQIADGVIDNLQWFVL